MIVHVLRQAEAAQIGRVAVATDTPEIAAAVTAHGGEAVMTRADHPSGSDRIYEALGKLDPEGETEIVVNLQGDFPTIPPDNIRAVLAPLADPAVDIATLAARNPYRGGKHQPERGQGDRLSARARDGCARSISPAPPRLGATGRATTTSASMPIAARRWSASSGCRPRRWNSARSSSSCGRLRPACGSTSTIVDTVPRGVDTPARPRDRPRAYWPKAERLLQGAMTKHDQS